MAGKIGVYFDQQNIGGGLDIARSGRTDWRKVGRPHACG